MGVVAWLLGRSSGAERASKPSRPAAEIQWRPDSFPTSAVGESFYVEALEQICGGRSRAGHDLDRQAMIQLDPTNKHDPAAIKVLIGGRLVGHLSRDDAPRVGNAMRALGVSSAACAARITGGWRTNQHDEGDFSVRLAIPRRGQIDFGSAGKAPEESNFVSGESKAAPRRPEASESGPLLGEWIVIMGAPGGGELAQRLAAAGAKMMAGVGKSTTTLVVAGDVEPFSVGTRRSATFRKAEEAAAAGQSIRILSEREALAEAARPAASGG